MSWIDEQDVKETYSELLDELSMAKNGTDVLLNSGKRLVLTEFMVRLEKRKALKIAQFEAQYAAEAMQTAIDAAAEEELERQEEEAKAIGEEMGKELDKEEHEAAAVCSANNKDDDQWK